MRRLAAIGLLALAIAGCTNQASQPAVTYQTYTYTCCQNGETTQAWHAGERRTIKWTAVPGAATTDARVTTIVISTRFSGPFATVDALKSASASPKGKVAARTVLGIPISVNNRTGEAVVSVIQLPTDLPAGYYNLDLIADYGAGNGTRGGSVVVVN